MRNGLRWIALLGLGLAACVPPAPVEEEPVEGPVAFPEWARPQHPVIDVPEDDVGAATLERRQADQLATSAEFGVFFDFGFRDRVMQSGIDFRHRVVDDSGKHYRPVHYDHGNGVAAADVDGDGRLDLLFTTQIGSNRLYRNVGGGQFEDMTDHAGIGLAERISVAASFGDYDNDDDPDLFVTTVRMGNVLFRNDGSGRFIDVSETAGVGYSGHSSGSVFVDYDRDGWLDLFVTNVGRYTNDEVGRGKAFVGLEDAFSGHLFEERTETSILYRNLGDGSFEDVSVATLLVDGSWSGDASFTDFDGDLDPDLYLLNMQGDDHYYENQDGVFIDRSRDLFPVTPWGAMGIKFFDWDNDGRLDLLLTDMHSDMSEEIGVEREKLKSDMKWPTEMLQGPENNIWGNAFFHNRGDGRFEEVSDRVGAENYWPWGLSVGDLNSDGWQDVFITASMNYPFRYGVNTVLLNDGGERFRDSEFILRVEPRRGGRTRIPWFNVFCSGEDQGHEHCTEREGPHTVMANLGSRSSVILDLDGDGDLDIVTNEFNAEPQVLVSNLKRRSDGQHYLAVRLLGTRSNRDGLGTRVTVHAGGRSFTRYHDGKSGYLSQSLIPLWFGLGDAVSVERVEVLWPSGATQSLEMGLGVDQTLEIIEPS